MAKKNKKDKKITMNQIVKQVALRLIVGVLYNEGNTITKNEAFELVDNLREYILSKGYLDDLKHLNIKNINEIFNSVAELIYFSKTFGKDDFYKNFSAVRKNLIDSVSEEGINIGYYLAISSIYGIFKAENTLNHFDNDESKINLIFLMAIYLILSILPNFIKFKNYKIKGFTKDLDIVYSKIQLIDNNILVRLTQDIYDFDSLAKAKSLILKDLTESSYYNFMAAGIKDEFKRSPYKYVVFTKEILSSTAIYSKDSPIIPIKDLYKIPKDRKYLVYKGGVRFDFVKKECIDHIDMVERDSDFLFKISVVNDKKSIYASTNRAKDTSLEEITKPNFLLKDSRIDLSFLIGKNTLNDEYNISELNLASMSFILDAGKDIDNIRYILMTCIYLAYYEPYKFRNLFKMYNLSKSKSGYKREDTFRVAHLRKLPVGASMSEEALKRAKLAGFGEIPTGYTFVREYNSLKEDADKEDKMKVIKIK